MCVFCALKIIFFQVLQNIEGFCLGIHQAAVLYVFHKAIEGVQQAGLIERQGKCGVVFQPQIQDDSRRRKCLHIQCGRQVQLRCIDNAWYKKAGFNSMQQVFQYFLAAFHIQRFIEHIRDFCNPPCFHEQLQPFPGKAGVDDGALYYGKMGSYTLQHILREILHIQVAGNDIIINKRRQAWLVEDGIDLRSQVCGIAGHDDLFKIIGKGSGQGMADGRCAGHFFMKELLHEFVDFRGVKKQRLPGIRGKAEGVLAGQQHAGQQ